MTTTKEANMALSKPLEFVAFRMDPGDLERLRKIAGGQKLTLSEVLRRGAALYAAEARDSGRRRAGRSRVAAS